MVAIVSEEPHSFQQRSQRAVHSPSQIDSLDTDVALGRLKDRGSEHVVGRYEGRVDMKSHHIFQQSIPLFFKSDLTYFCFSTSDQIVLIGKRKTLGEAEKRIVPIIPRGTSGEVSQLSVSFPPITP